MTTAEMVTYAYDQIDQARTELNAEVGRKSTVLGTGSFAKAYQAIMAHNKSA
jgi:hypothetical protein